MNLQDSSRVTYGSQISDRIWMDNNSQLIIRDAVLARCGSYDYLESEILPNGSDSKIVQVYRTEDEVFDPVSLASFENKPFCNDHPEDDVCPENYKDLQVGFIRDIRRGTGELSNCLIGDIVVTDPEVIELIKSGEKRELSLGYKTQIIMGEDGKYYMTKIRGNHLALVEDGRAGNATIRDKNTIKNKKGEDIMAKKIIFKPSARDKFVKKLYDEDVVEIEELEDDEEEITVEEIPEEEPVVDDEPVIEETDIVEDADEGVDSTQQIISLLTQILDAITNMSNGGNNDVVDEDLPVEENVEAPVEEVTEDTVDEDVTAEMTEDPKIYDQEEDEIEEQEDDVVPQNDSSSRNSSLYAPLVHAADNNSLKQTADDINTAFVNRYKKFGGKN